MIDIARIIRTVRKPAVGAPLTCVVAVLFALFIWPTLYSYHHGKSGSAIVVYRMNRFTGNVQVIEEIDRGSRPSKSRLSKW